MIFPKAVQLVSEKTDDPVPVMKIQDYVKSALLYPHSMNGVL